MFVLGLIILNAGLSAAILAKIRSSVPKIDLQKEKNGEKFNRTSGPVSQEVLNVIISESLTLSQTLTHYEYFF
jgi:hypothetical protein